MSLTHAELEKELGTVTDKFQHGYVLRYMDIAEELGPAARVLEIGVWKGGSLKLWQRLFPEGIIAGVDNHRDIQPEWPEGTHRIDSDQENPTLPDLARNVSPEWDLIIDDASHCGTPSTVTFNLLWPLVRPGGWYSLEDWGVGIRGNQPHFGAYEGKSMLTLAQSFVERVGRYRDRYDADMDEVHYFPSLALIRKRSVWL